MVAKRLETKVRSNLHALEKVWDRSRFAVKERLGLVGTPMIQPYRGFGDRSSLWVRGRVIEDQGVTTAPHTKSLWTNLWLTAKRYETDEIPGAQLEWRFGSRRGEIETDAEGFFDFSFEPGDDFDPVAEWQNVIIRLIEAPNIDTRPLSAEVLVRTPRSSAKFGIISDIDDTIIKTGAWNFAKHWRTVVANSAESREAFKGVSEVYGKFASGRNGAESNPVFYVSSSPWNLFDLFERFMVLHDIPVGPMMLKDYGLTDAKWLTGGHLGHKSAMIDRIMDAYPDMQFVLIGDSGQRDPVIYRDVLERRPDQVAAALIRTVGPQKDKTEVQELDRALHEAGKPCLCAETLDGATDILAHIGA